MTQQCLTECPVRAYALPNVGLAGDPAPTNGVAVGAESMARSLRQSARAERAVGKRALRNGTYSCCRTTSFATAYAESPD